MPTHDAYARRTPLEITFPERDDPTGGFGRIRAELDGPGADPSDPGTLLGTAAARERVSGLMVDGAETELLQQYASLLYHAYQVWEAGSEVLLLGSDQLRGILGEEGTDPPASLRDRSLYVQLPQHLVWMVGGEDGEGERPESVDGFFLTVARGRIAVLLAVGLRPDRPGFTVVDLPIRPVGELPGWLEQTMRPDGGDFSSSIPGAELEGLVEMRTAGEVYKLVARVLVALEAGELEPAPGGNEPPPGGPPASGLPFHRLRL